MTTEELGIELGLAAAQLGYQAYKEDWSAETVADKFIELGLKFLPHASLQASLTKNGIAIAEAAADIAEDAKFGPKP